MSREPIFERVLHEAEQFLHHRRYHQDSTHATPATEAPPMSFADIENEIHKLVEHAKQIEGEVLPAAAGGLKQLEGLAGNPVVTSLLSAVHVPTEALAMAVKVIDGLEELYKPETAVAAPAVPEVPAAPAEPAAAV